MNKFFIIELIFLAITVICLLLAYQFIMKRKSHQSSFIILTYLLHDIAQNHLIQKMRSVLNELNILYYFKYDNKLDKWSITLEIDLEKYSYQEVLNLGSLLGMLESKFDKENYTPIIDDSWFENIPQY